MSWDRPSSWWQAGKFGATVQSEGHERDYEGVAQSMLLRANQWR